MMTFEARAAPVPPVPALSVQWMAVGVRCTCLRRGCAMCAVMRCVHCAGYGVYCVMCAVVACVPCSVCVMCAGSQCWMRGIERLACAVRCAWAGI
eukprot:3320588-Rhodomonas_salina.1